MKEVGAASDLLKPCDARTMRYDLGIQPHPTRNQSWDWDRGLARVEPMRFKTRCQSEKGDLRIVLRQIEKDGRQQRNLPGGPSNGTSVRKVLVLGERFTDSPLNFG